MGNNLKYISRIEQIKTGKNGKAIRNFCWTVCYRQDNKKKYRTFADVNHGSKEQALKAAIEFRDAQGLARIQTRKKPIELQHIFRIDQSKILAKKGLTKETHCWTVRFGRVKNGQRNHDVVHKTFSDSTYGSKDKALEAAKAYRDEIKVLTELPKREPKLSVNKTIEVHGLPGAAYITPELVKRVKLLIELSYLDHNINKTELLQSVLLYIATRRYTPEKTLLDRAIKKTSHTTEEFCKEAICADRIQW